VYLVSGVTNDAGEATSRFASGVQVMFKLTRLWKSSSVRSVTEPQFTQAFESGRLQRMDTEPRILKKEKKRDAFLGFEDVTYHKVAENFLDETADY
jgi:hypothetical protein